MELVKLKEALQQAIDRLQTQQQRADLRELRTDVEMQHIVPVTIKMAGFDELKKEGTTLVQPSILHWHGRIQDVPQCGCQWLW